jgi:hypothetical protein
VASAATSVATSTKATTTVETSTVARTTVEAGWAAMKSTAARAYEVAWAGVEAQTPDARRGRRT